MEYQRDEQRVHLIVYHLIWCPKRRKAVLTGDIAKDCHEIVGRKCTEKGWEVVELAIQPDHIHLFVRAFPDIPASEIVKECKGLTSFELRKKYPAILKLYSSGCRHYGHVHILRPRQAMSAMSATSAMTRSSGMSRRKKAYDPHSHHSV